MHNAAPMMRDDGSLEMGPLGSPSSPSNESTVDDILLIQHNPSTPCLVYVCVLMGCLNSLLLGYDIGVISGAVIYIDEAFDLTDGQTELFVGCLNVVAAIGAIASGYVTDRYGRKRTIAAGAVLFFVGIFCLATAVHFAALLIGRLITGIAIGTALMIAPLYTTEIAPARMRGFLVSFAEISINFGILLGYFVNWIMRDAGENNWRYMIAVGLVPPILILMSLCIIPESPRWLMLRRRRHDAMKSLLALSGGNAEEADRELTAIEISLTDKSKADKLEYTWKEIFTRRDIRRMLIVAVGVHFFQQATGSEAVVYYSPEILEHVGITSEDDQLLATVLIGVCKFSFIIIATFLLDRKGRRSLLVISASGIMASLMILAISTFTASGGFAIFALCSFMASFSIGFGPVAWVLASEVLSSPIRGKALSLATLTNRLTSGLCVITFLTLSNALTVGGLFFMYSAVAVVALLFCLRIIPETKNRSLEEIQLLMNG